MHIIIVGSGLAGLAAAIASAARGAHVTVLERSPDAGGRATTSAKQGYLFNIGPHALYARAEALLGELGVSVRGEHPPLERTVAWREGRPYHLPLGTAALLATDLLNDSDRLEAEGLFAALGQLDTAALQDLTIDAWLDRTIHARAVRSLVEAFLRVSSYANAPALASAGAHIDQLRATIEGGVRYVDGGWQTIVDGLRERARAARVRFETGARVTSVVPAGASWRIRTSAGPDIDADAVVLAVAPGEASNLVPSSAALATWADRAIPVAAASLDIALARLPRPACNYSIGIDRPLYFSVHSVAARLAPAGGGVLHAAMYLSPSERATPSAVRAELEWMVDEMQPGWRDLLVHRRYLPHVKVTNALVTAADGGLPGRAGPRVPDARGLFVAGDWVGPVGMLAEAALASGVAAGQLAARVDERAVA